MSRTLFDRPQPPQPPSRKRGGTVVVSIVLHAAGLAGLVAVQFGNVLDAVSVTRPVVFAMAIKRSPVMRDVAPQPRSLDRPSLDPDAAPTEPASTPAPDAPLDPHAGGPPFPGPITTAGRADGLPFGRGTVNPVTLPPPPPPAPPVEPVRVGGLISTPERLVYARPVYPHIAQTARVEGTVILEATIDELGAVRNVRVLRSIAMLDQAAIDAVSRWRYTPTRLNGVAVPVIMTVTVTFTLR